MKDKILTIKQFKEFQKHFMGWADQLGLRAWEIHFVLVTDETDFRATTSASLEDRMAVITISENWGLEDITPDSLSKTAFHEALELLLWEYDEIAASGEAPDKARLDSVRHSIIRTLENLIGDRKYDATVW